MSLCQRQNVCLLPDCDWSIAAPVGIIDYCVERLVDPLPEQHGWSRPARFKTGQSVKDSVEVQKRELDCISFVLQIVFGFSSRLVLVQKYEN